MKNAFDLTKLALLGSAACIFPALLANAADKTNYVTVREITAMAPCTATFAKRLSEYSGAFTNVDGKWFVLGDSRGEQWVWHFVSALKEGQTYKFPDAFLNYQAAPNYATAKEIVAMAPCTATLASRTPCSSYFSMADGKWFAIGSPSSGPQVSRFIWSLKDGEICEFPDTFLKFQTNSPTRKP